MIIIAGPDVPPQGPVDGLEIRDLTPTVLPLFGLDVPADLQGHAIEAALAREPMLR